MSKIDDFKEFVKKNPNLIGYVKKDEMTWQKFYEIWDLYGEKDNIWNKYKGEDEFDDSDYSWAKILAALKGVNVDTIRKNIDGIQKAITLFQDITKKEETKKPAYEPRPLYKRFED